MYLCSFCDGLFCHFAHLCKAQNMSGRVCVASHHNLPIMFLIGSFATAFFSSSVLGRSFSLNSTNGMGESLVSVMLYSLSMLSMYAVWLRRRVPSFLFLWIRVSRAKDISPLLSISIFCFNRARILSLILRPCSLNNGKMSSTCVPMKTKPSPSLKIQTHSSFKFLFPPKERKISFKNACQACAACLVP